MKKLIAFIITALIVSPAFGFDFDISKLTLTDGVQEYELDNGLKVLIKEEHSVPLVGFSVSYKVGFRNENVDGKTGLTHLLEHMMFKGTEKYAKGEISKTLDEIGAYFNAYTSYDRTVYWEVMPVAGLETAMDIEKERMINSLFDEEEFEKEKSVVLSEISMNESDPEVTLERGFYPLVFGDHPVTYLYGTLDDVASSERDYVYNELYRKYYTPNNACIIIVGDIVAEDALEMVKEYFGDIEANPDTPADTENPFDFVTGVSYTTNGVASEDFGEAYFDLPKYDPDNEDFINLAFLSTTEMLGGFGYWATIDGGVGYIGFSEEPEYPSETIDEDYIRENFDDFKTQMFNQEVMGYDSIYSIMMSLVHYERNGGIDLYKKLMNRYAEVTADDVIDVINRYLIADNSSSGFFIATEKDADAAPGSSSMEESHGSDIDYSELENPTEAEIAEAETLLAELYEGTVESMQSYLSTVEEYQLDNGLTVIYRPFSMNDNVSIYVGVDAGSVYQEKPNQASLTYHFVFGGGPQIQLKNDLAIRGASMYGSSSYNYASYYVEVLNEDFSDAIKLIETALENRTFIPLVLEEKKFLYVNALELMLNDPTPYTHARFEINRMSFGDEGAGLDFTDDPAKIIGLSMDDVDAFYRTFYRPEKTVVVVVGNIDIDSVTNTLSEALGDWEQLPAEMDETPAEIPTPDGDEFLSKPLGGYQSLLVMSAPTVDYSDVTNYTKWSLANTIFGGSGLSSRLMRRIRDEEGITYGVYTYPVTYGDSTQFRMYMLVSPDQVDLALELYDEEMAKYKADGPNDLEIAKYKTSIINSMIFEFQNAASIADSLLYYKMMRGEYDSLIDFINILYSANRDDMMKMIENYFPEDYFIVTAGG